jgi:hypothetical protein
MMLPPYAFFSGLGDKLSALAIKFLAVAGGFLVGYFIGGLLATAVNNWLFKKRAPEQFKQVCQMLAGIVLAILVALFVFGDGGGGLFGGGGTSGDGKGNPAADTNSQSKNEPNKKVDSNVSTPQVDIKPGDITIRVTVLAGAAVPSAGKFYLIDDDRTPISLTDLKNAIQSRKAQDKGKITLAVLFPTDPNHAPPRNDPKVTDVTRWATEEAGMDVVFPAQK